MSGHHEIATPSTSPDTPIVAPIDRLPVEILNRVFFCTIASFHEDNPCAMSVILSHVCTRWRNVSIRCKELWTYTPLQFGKELLEVALERSSPLPISVNGTHLPTFKSVERLSFVLRALGRIKDLALKMNGPVAVPISDPNEPENSQSLTNTSPAPLLESLILDIDKTFDISHVWLPENEKLLVRPPPPNIRFIELRHCRVRDLFSGNVPSSLRFLRLDDVDLLPTSCLFRAPLRRLELTRCHIWDDIQRLLDTLRLLPLLEEFYSIWPRGGVSSFLGEHHEVSVNLPRMKHIRLDGDASASAGVLHSIVLPSTTEICLAFDVADVPHNTIGDFALFSSLRSHYSSAAAGQVFHEANITGQRSKDEYRRIIVEGFTISLTQASHTTMPNDVQEKKHNLGDLRLTCLPYNGVYYQFDDLAPGLVHAFFDLLFVKNSLYTLTVSAYIFCNGTLWRGAFSNWDSITKLTVTEETVSGLFCAFASPNDPQLFPLLEDLTIYSTGTRLSALLNGPILPLLLQEGFRCRRAAGVRPLRRLEIVGNHRPSTVESDTLRQAVGHTVVLVWDGETEHIYG
ncbi:hypothetical protein OF83DRAFT_1140588 [Amylostereum chailletii]|nr:hypothetical protein OF83DRAFT_1140588 [Amylostereum chailletii]